MKITKLDKLLLKILDSRGNNLPIADWDVPYPRFRCAGYRLQRLAKLGYLKEKSFWRDSF